MLFTIVFGVLISTLIFAVEVVFIIIIAGKTTPITTTSTTGVQPRSRNRNRSKRINVLVPRLRGAPEKALCLYSDA